MHQKGELNTPKHGNWITSLFRKRSRSDDERTWNEIDELWRAHKRLRNHIMAKFDEVDEKITALEANAEERKILDTKLLEQITANRASIAELTRQVQDLSGNGAADTEKIQEIVSRLGALDAGEDAARAMIEAGSDQGGSQGGVVG